ncbi:MAG TPA: L,D-transpeptidase family protein [Acidimicrobiales bacterium]|nr:L,D-transpeptidase family protein [Acidimicrobiales bacterium]
MLVCTACVAVPALETTPAAASRASAGNQLPTLKLGDSGSAVMRLQQRLTELGYRPGAPDGHFGPDTQSAVLAFQKRNGLARTGIAGPVTLAELPDPKGAGPRPGRSLPRIEIDLARQIAFVILAGQPVITLNASTGTGRPYRAPNGSVDVAVTPLGTFTVQRKVNGKVVAPLGVLKDPMYFYRGWAIHGSTEVPAYPASHGCVRVSYADAAWLLARIPLGTSVVIYSSARGQSAGATPKDAAPGP